ncbi:MAG: hypothetical protein VXZ73_03625, partial [Pseudomonadota bacterium]|nr:hypothetical protein [Pseudomonadota bacterium]
GDFSNQDITLDSTQTLEISADIDAPGHNSGSGKVVTGTATPIIKITGTTPTIDAIPGVLFATGNANATALTTGATLDIGANVTSGLNLGSKTVYSTVDITSSGNTTNLTLPTGATLKLSQTYVPADAGLKMNGGTVEVADNAANIVPAVAKFDVSPPSFNTKKTLKFSAAHDANPLGEQSGGGANIGLDFSAYNTVFDTIELAHDTGNFSNQDITLHSTQTLEISADIDAPSGSNKIVTGTATPTIKITGTTPTIGSIPGVLFETGNATATALTTGATLDIGANVASGLDLSSKGVYSTVDITSAGNTTQITGMPANATLKLSSAYAPGGSTTIAYTNKLEVTGESSHLTSSHQLEELDTDFTVTGGHGHLVLSDNGTTSNLTAALAGQTLGLDGTGSGTAEFRTLEVKNTFDAPANAFKLGKNATLILNDATLSTNEVKFESGVDYPVVKLKADSGSHFGASGSSHGINLQPNAAGDEFDLVVGESGSSQQFHFALNASSAPHIHKLVLDGGVLHGDIGDAANPMTGIIQFDGGTVVSGNTIYAVNSIVEMKNTDTSVVTAIGDIEGSNNTLSLGADRQLGTFAASGFESTSSQPFVFSSFSGLDTNGGKLSNGSYLKLTSTASDAALHTLTESATSYATDAKVALHLDDTNLVLGGKTLPDEIDAILVENGNNTSAGGTELNLEMTAASERNIWNAQFKYTDPTATRVSPTFDNGSHNKVLVSGLQPGTEVYKLTGAGSGNKLGFYDVPGDFVIRASGAANNAWTVCTNATCTATAGGSKIFTLTTAEHGVDGYLSFSEESQALLDTRYEFLGSKVASIVNRSSGDNGFTKYGFRSTRAASSKAPKYSAMTSGMSYKTDMSNMVSVAKGVKSTVGIEFTHGKVMDAKNLAFGTYVAMDKDLMPTVAVGGVYNMNYETLIRSNIPTGATTIGSHDKDVAHFFTHTANLHATKSDILKFAGHSLGARLNFNALFTPEFVSSGVTYHKNDLYQVVPELTLDMKLGMLGLNGKLTGAYYSYLGDFKQEISITNGTNTVTEKYEIDGKTGVFAQLELDKSISKHAKLSVNGTLGEHKLYSLGLALKVEA